MTSFRPLATIISAIMRILILGDALHLGGILGAILIVIGLYVTLWRKRERERYN
ncbi:hypothetical protein Patl1_33179 [Pistacia atlantica]|uniref:Uncharacterized protein n=1 Tax=Pistacia atlantica TaxID=434234 RepID=A0ACC1AQU8_9ROSI|nr:hypothetical protein Patl1_33179 [Pistacia atlantica]